MWFTEVQGDVGSRNVQWSAVEISVQGGVGDRNVNCAGGCC